MSSVESWISPQTCLKPGWIVHCFCDFALREMILRFTSECYSYFIVYCCGGNLTMLTVVKVKLISFLKTCVHLMSDKYAGKADIFNNKYFSKCSHFIVTEVPFNYFEWQNIIKSHWNAFFKLQNTIQNAVLSDYWLHLVVKGHYHSISKTTLERLVTTATTLLHPVVDMPRSLTSCNYICLRH